PYTTLFRSLSKRLKTSADAILSRLWSSANRQRHRGRNRQLATRPPRFTEKPGELSRQHRRFVQLRHEAPDVGFQSNLAHCAPEIARQSAGDFRSKRITRAP